MSLKNVKLKMEKFNTITSRLILFYTLVSFFLLSSLAIIFYRVSTNIIYDANKLFLKDESKWMIELLSQQPIDIRGLQQEVEEVAYEGRDTTYSYFASVKDEKGNRIAQTRGFEHVEKYSRFFDTQNINTNSGSVYEYWSDKADKAFYFFKTKKVIGSHTYTIEIALDISYQEAAFKIYKLLIIALVGIGMFLAVTFSWLISRNAMRGLSKIIDAVKNISVKVLSDRLTPEKWPQEIQVLAHSFNKMLDRLESDYKSLEQLSDNIAHEMKTPITSIICQTELGITESNSVSELQQVLIKNLDEVKHILQILNGLMFLADADKSDGVLNFQKIPVKKAIQRVCDYYQSGFDDKGINLNIQGDGLVWFEPGMFTRMISNLISNALKFTSENGKVDIFIEEYKSNLNIIITDTGIGIPTDEIDLIFNRFYRVKGTEKKIKGTGLGLSIAKAIILLHNGTIQVSSKLTQGTSVNLTLPK